jgi:glycogen debranching enzyme
MLQLLLAALLLPASASTSAQTLSSLAIEVQGASRPFVFTNTVDAFYYGETGGPNTTGWQGFNVRGKELLDDYLLLVQGKPFPRTASLKTVVFPDHLERHYPGGILEEVWPVDSVPLIGVTLLFPAPADAGIVPLVTDARSREALTIRLSPGVALLARTQELERPGNPANPRWLGVSGSRALPETLDTRLARQYGPVRLYGHKARKHTFLIAAGRTESEVHRFLQTGSRHASRLRAERRHRLEAELSRTCLRTGLPEFDKALAWARLSLNALIMNQTGKGIFAGLPWFNNYWGRDTFIALPGATLVTGAYPEAREILRSFSVFQNRDSTSADYGRIPNIVTPADTAFNTADGTPRFVMTAREYIERSGDEAFLLEIYPVVLRSIEGTLRYHTDSLGFLVHADAETWMDAVGPDGPWSPRGNRANDIQALWAEQLEAGIWFATRLGDVHSARTWHVALERLRGSFARHFVFSGRIADHLRPDGSRDFQVRPNQIFTAPLLADADRRAMLDTVLTQLTYPHGVASLAQTDEQFHPYHEYPPYYPKDAAYHNGIVWTWLQGPVISELCKAGLKDSAFVLTQNAMDQILRRGAVGTQSELLDALARPGEAEPRLSGTVSQAWNLAEFVRNAYDDYLGLRVSELNRTVTLRPRVPAKLGDIEALIPLGGKALTVSIIATARPAKLTLHAPVLDLHYTVTVDFPGETSAGSSVSFPYSGGTATAWLRDDSTAELKIDGIQRSVPAHRIARGEATGQLAGLHLTVPLLKPGLMSIRGPEHPLLSHETVAAPVLSTTPFLDLSDPSGDDLGTGAVLRRGGRITYPANAHFMPGSFDITRFTLHTDSLNASFTLQFRALSDPGWHPEYGFQLTLAAIAIDTDGKEDTGSATLPAQALYAMPDGRGYERLILVGGRMQIQDQTGKILAEYVPTEKDAANPIGNAGAGTIRFTVPLSILGVPGPRWRFVVVAGGQDDHGGAGIGEFRAVQADKGDWNGGGRLSPADSNIYDELVGP